MKTTTLLMAALIICFTSGTVLADSHRADRKKRGEQQVERASTVTATTRQYKTTYQQEQHPNRRLAKKQRQERRWAKKQRQERRRDYVVQHENHRQPHWQQYSKRHHYNDRYRDDCRQHNTYQIRSARQHRQVERIIVPFPPIPRVVLTFPW